ncbi:unnamed protein product [Nesidiocoris tenuis]|uniref:Uncharacterized protein n=1 Tax=Nesidiocoris tenuis TaxID=355587 RepID=A0A6H5HFQ8_9HEMI|nr:unnamed protein product [Nesidiocoris tenuis]
MFVSARPDALFNLNSNYSQYFHFISTSNQNRLRDQSKLRDQSQLRDQTQLRNQCRLRVQTQLRDQSQFRDRTQLRDQTQLRNQCRLRVQTQLRVRSQLRYQIQLQVRSQLRDQIQLRDQNRLRDQSQLRDQTKLRHQIQLQVRSQLRTECEISDHWQLRRRRLLKDASLFCAHATSHAERKHSELLGLNCGGSEQIAEAARTRATYPGEAKESIVIVLKSDRRFRNQWCDSGEVGDPPGAEGKRRGRARRAEEEEDVWDGRPTVRQSQTRAASRRTIGFLSGHATQEFSRRRTRCLKQEGRRRKRRRRLPPAEVPK